VVSLRHPTHRALWQIAAAAMAGFRQSLMALDFTEIQTPKIVASATESGANVFEIEYFDRPAYLAQSPQFYKQMMVGVFERVFEVGPVFRAEPHNTSRHLTQYTSLDAEMGFIENHFTVMQTLTHVIAGMMTAIAEQAQSALSTLELTLPTVPESIPHIHFTEAHELYCEATGIDSRNEPDLDPAEERWLGTWAQSEFNSDFLFVTGYPMKKRPFYTHPDPSRPMYSNSFDLLFRGLELVTGGQRLHKYEQYLEAMEQFNINPEPIEGYLAAFKHGMPPHGGWAIGLERFVTQLTGRSNVREASLFPRDMQRLTP
jgi:nondiscriminating aspartyl-tRNA synthetase